MFKKQFLIDHFLYFLSYSLTSGAPVLIYLKNNRDIYYSSLTDDMTDNDPNE